MIRFTCNLLWMLLAISSIAELGNLFFQSYNLINFIMLIVTYFKDQ